MLPFSENDVARYVNESEEARACLGAAPGAALAVRLLAQGEYNVNYTVWEGARLLPFVVRVNTASQMGLEDQIGYEMGALRVLEPSGRTPRACFADGSRRRFPFGVGIEELLPGRPLDYETDLGRAADVLACVHTVPVPPACGIVRPERPLRAMLDECASLWRVYAGWAHAEAEVVARVEAMARRARALAEGSGDGAPVRCVINTELNSGNFLVNDDRPTYLVDWEKPLVADPAQDLAHLLAPTTTFWKTDVLLSRERMQRCLEAYVRAVDGRIDVAGLADRFDVYLTLTCLRGVTWCAMAKVGYASGTHAAANASTAAKLDAYLSPDFLDEVWRRGGYA